jgi:fatty-acyl-CoA synthase
MQNHPLLLSGFLEHAVHWHGDREIVSRSIEGPIHRTTYRAIGSRAKRLGNSLASKGIKPGDRIGTLAWNGYRHMEIYYGVSGQGAVCHTINPRLFEDQIVFIVNHAHDRWLFLDLTFLPLVERIQDKIPCVEKFVIMTDEMHMPQTSLANPYCYETLISEGKESSWPTFDENCAAILCYTSGTTGNPKGVLYSHRSLAIHTLSCNNKDVIGIGSCDSVLPVVPMFHVNAWGIPYMAAAVGAKLVFPGSAMDAESIYELLETEQVTLTAGVPTVWLQVLGFLEKNNKFLSSLKRVMIGGSACPQFMFEAFEKKYGVTVHHAWGMTEMSPLGTFNSPKAGMELLPPEKYTKKRMKQGRPPYGVEIKISNAEGNALPHNGEDQGDLKVRGVWIIRAYYKIEEENILDDDGWFSTGDIATIDSDGYIQITDRIKDIIKSGGEWISSVELENIAAGHPEVMEAAVIGIPHPKWDERPLLVVVKKQNSTLTKNEVLEYMGNKLAKWMLPDDVVFVDAIPHTATGKIQKMEIREQFKHYKKGMISTLQ